LTAETEGSASAARFRKDHHLGVQPLGDLLEVIEQATGIDVAVLDVGPDEHGLTMRDPARGTVFIGVARTRNPMRQRSTLAHELGHVLFEDWVDSLNWRKLTTRWIQILPDDTTPELATVVQRVSGLPMDERRRQAKDLGEIMVIALAVVTAESGHSVTILMDDGPGAVIATSEISRLRG
jgi:hypothetical protein